MKEEADEKEKFTRQCWGWDVTWERNWIKCMNMERIGCEDLRKIKQSDNMTREVSIVCKEKSSIDKTEESMKKGKIQG